LLAAVFRPDRRLTEAELVFRVPGLFAFPRAVADFLAASLLVVAADLLSPPERFDLARLLAATFDLAFFLVDCLFPLRGFCSPVKTSTNEVTALFATSTAAFTFALAASLMASRALGVRPPSFALPSSV
jgi:hypothetical protein